MTFQKVLEEVLLEVLRGSSRIIHHRRAILSTAARHEKVLAIIPDGSLDAYII